MLNPRFILVLLLLKSLNIHSQIFQSITTFQSTTSDFLPANPIELIVTLTNIPTVISCYIQCNMNPSCRTFVSDTSWPFICRLYQSSIDTGTIIISSSSSTSQVGSLHYDASLYIAYNQTCFSNGSSSDRYLICTNRTLRCPMNTYWNGTMCVNKVYYFDSCNINDACQSDVNLQCSSSCNKCLCKSITVWNGTSCVQSTCPSLLPDDLSLVALWLLDNNTSDLMNIYNGTLIGTPSFVPGYINQAINMSMNNSIKLINMNFYQQSFTVELWFYLTNTTKMNMILFSQCANMTLNQCIYFGINTNKTLYMGSGFNEISGKTSVTTGIWNHVGFVYDYFRRQQYIYLNGLLEINTSYLYLGQSSNIIIGSNSILNHYFSGYIDHVSIMHRIKTDDEILDDASLVAYYSFDCGSTFDAGPNLLHGTAIGQNIVAGRKNNALEFKPVGGYFQAYGFTSLGFDYQSYSISLWIKPLNLSGTLVHISSHSNGTGYCWSMLGFHAAGGLTTDGPVAAVFGPNIPLNSWTHIVQTFSNTNGIRLYVNRTLYSSSPIRYFSKPPYTAYLTLGSKLSGDLSCHSAYIIQQAYAGAIDEVRIYNREISASEVCTLFSQN